VSRRIGLSALGLALAIGLAACGKKDEPPAQAPVAAAASSAVANAAAPVPDIGKVETATVTAQGFGGSASEAVAEAMKLAILQVNGASVDMSSLSVKHGLDVTLNQSSASLRASSFTDAVRQRSGGVIQNFKVLSLAEPASAGGRFQANIEAAIAKFAAPESMKRIKVVVAPPKFESATLSVGDQTLSSVEVAAGLRQRIVDALVNTGRFAVLDREFSPELQQELALISEGKAPSAEAAKLAQAASADLVWSAQAKLGYLRHARQLKASGRELVSYSGGWSITQKLVNVATRQVTASSALQGQAPSTEPTTLGSGVDSQRLLAQMTDDMVKEVVASILQKTFPVTVVSRDGDSVVLSQGGQALREGARYAMVVLGAQLKDPQTGQSLGRVERPCCEVVVEKVASNLSYGRLERLVQPLDRLPEGALQLREEVKAASKVAAEDGPVVESAGVEPTAARTRPVKGQQDEPQTVRTAPSKNDDKW
jgi:curli biogenesis system outer membrane secretion channel CsgG